MYQLSFDNNLIIGIKTRIAMTLSINNGNWRNHEEAGEYRAIVRLTIRDLEFIHLIVLSKDLLVIFGSITLPATVLVLCYGQAVAFTISY